MKVLFRVVQPWGRDKATQSTTISEHATVADAFNEIDRLVSEWSEREHRAMLLNWRRSMRMVALSGDHRDQLNAMSPRWDGQTNSVVH